MRKGLSQAQLAKLAGVDHSQVSKLESDQRGVSDTTVSRIEEALGITPLEWITLDVDMFTSIELAIAFDEDSTLSRTEQRALLAAYGQLTGRDSVAKAEAIWRRPDSDAAD